MKDHVAFGLPEERKKTSDELEHLGDRPLVGDITVLLGGWWQGE